VVIVKQLVECINGRGKYSEETCLSPALLTTDPVLLDPSSNLGQYGGKAATKRMSYGTTVS
jgi:hypothetical protein